MVVTTGRVQRWRPVLLELVVVATCLCDALVVANNYNLATWVSTAGALMIPLRHRFPVFVLLLNLPAAGLRTALLPAGFALFALCRSRGNLRDVAPFVLMAFLALLVPWPPGPSALATASLPALVQAIVYAAALAAAPAALGLLGATTEELKARITELSRTRDSEERLRAAQAVTAERARIAREMHDVVAHKVSLIAVQAGALQVSSKDEDVRRTAGQLRRLSVRTLTELRAMVGFLRAAGASSAVDLAPQPTLADLPRLTGDAGFDVTLCLADNLTSADPDQPDLPAPVQRAAYRTVQEALTNVRKHASGAPATVTVGRQGSALTVEVINTAPTSGNGQHSAARLPSGGHGLVGLRERASMLGGAVTAGPTVDGGYRLRASFPLGPAAR
ncbi:MAG TPA: histidine kinase [Pseudonocardiaceae bacterium]